MRGEVDDTDQVVTVFGLGDPRPPSEQPARTVSFARRRWAGLLRLVGVLALLCTVAIGALSYSLLLPTMDESQYGRSLMVGDWFPTWLDAAITTTAIGVSALVLAAMLAPPIQTGLGRGICIGVVLALAALVPVALTPTAIVGAGQLLSRHNLTVLPEVSPGGCRIVVSEHSFGLNGSGGAGIIQPGSIVITWIRDYRADDGIRPFATGRYSLEWDGRIADLQLRPQGDAISWTTNGALVCNR